MRHWLPKREGAHEVGRTASGYYRCNINLSHPRNIRKTNHSTNESSISPTLSAKPPFPRTTHDLLDETIFIIFAELTHFHKTLEECKSPQDKLFYLFKNIGMIEDADENWITDEFWEAFFDACEIAAFSEEKRIKYEQEMYDERRLQGELGASMEIGMKKGLAEGLEKGRAEGLAEGRAEGRAEGLAEGRAEGEENAKIATAKRMLTKGMPIELTAEISGLSVERVMEL